MLCVSASGEVLLVDSRHNKNQNPLPLMMMIVAVDNAKMMLRMMIIVIIPRPSSRVTPFCSRRADNRKMHAWHQSRRKKQVVVRP
jgi:hypothetical protein